MQVTCCAYKLTTKIIGNNCQHNKQATIVQGCLLTIHNHFSQFCYLKKKKKLGGGGGGGVYWIEKRKLWMCIGTWGHLESSGAKVRINLLSASHALKITEKQHR